MTTHRGKIRKIHRVKKSKKTAVKIEKPLPAGQAGQVEQIWSFHPEMRKAVGYDLEDWQGQDDWEPAWPDDERG